MKIALISPPWELFTKNITFDQALIPLSKGLFHSQDYNYKFMKSLWPTPNYPLSLLSIASNIKNHDVRIFDCARYNSTKMFEEIKKFRPDVAGFTVMTSPSILWIDKVSRDLKNRFKTIIVYGGNHATLIPKETLKSSVADYILGGDGEYTFKILIDYLNGKSELPKQGITYWKKGKIISTPPYYVDNLDTLPELNFDLINLKDYKDIALETSRGCVYNCDFCVFSEQKSKWRFKSPEKVISELKKIKCISNTKGKTLYFVDYSFGINKKRVREICKLMIKEKINMEWYSLFTLNSLDKETLKYLSKANCINIYTGIETGSENLAKRYKKVGGISQTLRIIRNIKEAGITPVMPFVLMLPGETKKDLEKTIKIVEKISNIKGKNMKMGSDAMFDPCLFRPYPNTKSYNDLVKKGFKSPKTMIEWGELMRDIYTLNNFDRYNFTKDITKGDIKKTLLKFSMFNFKSYLLPRTKKIIKGFFTKDI